MWLPSSDNDFGPDVQPATLKNSWFTTLTTLCDEEVNLTTSSHAIVDGVLHSVEKRERRHEEEKKKKEAEKLAAKRAKKQPQKKKKKETKWKKSAMREERSRKLKEKPPAERATRIYLHVNMAKKEKLLRWIGAARWTYNEALEKAEQERRRRKKESEQKKEKDRKGSGKKRKCMR